MKTARRSINAFEHINELIVDDIFREAIHRLHIGINSRKLPDVRVEIARNGLFKLSEEIMGL